jgi:hypothetical protein
MSIWGLGVQPSLAGFVTPYYMTLTSLGLSFPICKMRIILKRA